jgi:hypothetical protein
MMSGVILSIKFLMQSLGKKDFLLFTLVEVFL